MRKVIFLLCAAACVPGLGGSEAPASCAPGDGILTASRSASAVAPVNGRASERSDRRAARIVETVRGIHAVGLPADPPRALRRDPLVLSEYPDYGPAEAFLMPVILKRRERSLYRRAQRFWDLPLRIRNEVVPPLIERTLEEDDREVQDNLLGILAFLLEDAIDTSRGAEIAREGGLRIAASDLPSETRVMFLRGLQPLLPEAPPGTGDALLAIATQEDDRICVAALQALVFGSWVASETGAGVLRDLARSDRGAECRGWAVVALRGSVPSSEWSELMIESLKEAVEKKPHVGVVLVRQLTVETRTTEAAPTLMKCLSAEDLELKGVCIAGLELLCGVREMDLGYSFWATTTPYRGTLKDASMIQCNRNIADAQGEATAAWKRWWSQNAAGCIARRKWQ